MINSGQNLNTAKVEELKVGMVFHARKPFQHCVSRIVIGARENSIGKMQLTAEVHSATVSYVFLDDDMLPTFLKSFEFELMKGERP